MRHRNPKQKLLDDVFASDVEPSLATVRRSARRRRRWRHGRIGATALLAMVVGCLWLRERPTVGKQNVTAASSPTDLVASSPLVPGFVVRSAGDALAVVHNEAFPLLVVTTEQAATEPEMIDDEGLLLFAPGAILVRLGTGSADLVFPERPGLSSHRPSGLE